MTEEEFQTVFIGCSSVIADQFYPKGQSDRRGEYLRDQGVLYVALTSELRLRGIIEGGIIEEGDEHG